MQDNPGKFKRKRVIIPVILLIIGILAGLNLFLKSLQYQSTDDAFIEGPIVQISPKIAGYVKKVYIRDNQKVKKGDLLVEIDPVDFEVQLERAQAELEAAIAKSNSADVNVGLTGITSNANAKQAYSGIDSAKSQEFIAKNQIEVAKSTLEQSNAKIAESMAGLEQAKSEVDIAEAAAKLAKDDLARFKKLNSDGAISKQQYDNAFANYRMAASKVKAAKDGVLAQNFIVNSNLAAKSSAQKAILQAQAQLLQAKSGTIQAEGRYEQANTIPHNVAISRANAHNSRAEVKKLIAEVKKAKIELSYTKFYAPESGYITKKNVENGAYIQKGQALMAIVPENNWIIANFKENQLEKMKPGQLVNISVDAYPHKIFKGRVDSIQRGTGSRFSLLPPENAVGSYVKVVQRVPVKIVFTEKPDPAYILAPGMSVVPEVEVK